MIYIRRVLMSVVFLTSMLLGQASGAPDVASTPPMGWNSWDSFGRSITEAVVRHTAEKLSNELEAFRMEIYCY